MSNQKPKDYAEKYRILAGRTIFADYTTRKAYIKQNQKFVNVTPYAPTRDVSILTIIKEGEANTTAAEYNAYISNAQSQSQSAQPAGTAPSAPTITAITASNAQLSVAFTAGDEGSAPITNYEYSTDNGATFTARSPAAITSPISITGLTNGTTYQVVLRAVNSVGAGAASSASAGTPVTTPSAPTITLIVPSSNTLAVTFTVPASDGGSTITNYEYSVNNGSTWTTQSPPSILPGVLITGLTNGTVYNVRIRAVNAIGSGTASAAVAATPSGPPGAPTLVTTLAGDSEAFVYFIVGANYGNPITNYEYSTDGVNFTASSPADTGSPVRIPGLTNGVTYNVYLRAVNAAGSGAASTSLTVTPASATAPSSYLEYNPSNPSSYSGSGTTVSNVGSFGTLNGTMSAGLTYNAGIAGGVFDFDGSDYISFGQFNFGDTFTIAAWIYPRNKTSINGLLANAGANQSPSGFKVGWNSWMQNNRVMLYEGGNGFSGGASATSSAVITYDAWNHVAYQINRAGQVVLFFINGVPADFSFGASTTNMVSGIGVNNLAFRIGSFTDSSYTMNAQLGSLKVFNSLLSAGQVAADYNTTKSRFGL